MGRELQKKKRRSGISKVTRKPKSKKQILSNPIIAANWDSTQTLSQNYARLGLTNRLNKQAGGRERFGVDKDSTLHSSALTVHPSGRKPSRPPSLAPAPGHQRRSSPEGAGQDNPEPTVPEVRVERDPETGAILRIVEPETQRHSEGSLQRPATAAEQSLARMGRKPLNQDHSGHSIVSDRDQDFSDEEFAGFADSHAPEGFIGSAALGESANPVIKELSDAALAARAQPKVKRKQSERERDWCMRMVSKHGADHTAMFKDRKMNVLQLSTGQIKQKITTYLADQ